MLIQETLDRASRKDEHPELEQNLRAEPYVDADRKWQGRLDSNQRMAGSKPAALPLGDAPVSVATSVMHSIEDSAACEPVPLQECAKFINFRAVWEASKTKKSVLKQQFTVSPPRAPNQATVIPRLLAAMSPRGIDQDGPLANPRNACRN